ncbi:unnamed protein product [Ambrosiozyma monospora]|uniref:Unnamed protein product n=1 Tax=Ambrosiozyma monospora TaxID=43982 RepID=A0A9W7DK47_AMBMO|nr:unnamed protein product [Ambrosiozyma monospora]
MDDSKSLDLTKGHMSSPVSISSHPSRLGSKKKKRSSKNDKVEVDDNGESLIELRSELQHLMQMNKQNINEIESLLESVENPIDLDAQSQPPEQNQNQNQDPKQDQQGTNHNTGPRLVKHHSQSHSLRSKFSTSRFLSQAELNSISPPETARSTTSAVQRTQTQTQAGAITPTPPTSANTITTSFNPQDTPLLHHGSGPNQGLGLGAGTGAAADTGPGAGTGVGAGTRGYDDTVMKFDFAESDKYGLKKLIESTQKLIQREIEVEVDGDDSGEGEDEGGKNVVSVAQLNPETYENACEVRNALNMLIRTL